MHHILVILLLYLLQLLCQPSTKKFSVLTEATPEEGGVFRRPSGPPGFGHE
jgi:hypothetical protein